MKSRLEIKMNPTLVTPLQRVLGFNVSEKVYDRLEFNEQLIVDLLIQGYANHEIATVFGVASSRIKEIVHRIRFKLADSELTFHLEMKEIGRAHV